MERAQLQYIVDAMNDVHRILSETIEPGEDDFRKVFAVICNTLKRVVAQKEVLDDLRELGMRQEQFWAEYKEITENVAHFVGGLCNLERQVLIAAGVNSAAAESLIKEAIKLRTSLKDLKINRNEVRQNLQQLRNEACAIAKQLHDLPGQQNDQRKNKRILRRFYYAISGAAIIGADGSLFALSLGMSAAGSAVSGAFGSALIGAAVVVE